MDPDKIKVVAEWHTPNNHKQLQRFLGFTNFYHRFIHNYSIIASPLTKLTSVKTTFVWTPEADLAFEHLKDILTSATVHIQPNSDQQFILEVDASDSGVGAVLSPFSPAHSRWLSIAEQNYDVGNRELLAIKLALEEWRHWFEKAKKPFIVWTDDKNLSYLQNAKRLNSCQVSVFWSFHRFYYLPFRLLQSQTRRPVQAVCFRRAIGGTSLDSPLNLPVGWYVMTDRGPDLPKSKSNNQPLYGLLQLPSGPLLDFWTSNYVR